MSTTTLPEAPVVASRFDRWSDPFALLVANVALTGAALLPFAGRSLVTLPLALLLPGHALLAALRRPDWSLVAGGRLAGRVVLSLAVVSLTVLAVGWLVEVDQLPVVIGLSLVVTLCAIAAWFHPLPGRRDGMATAFTQSGVLGGLAVAGSLGLVVLAVLVLPEPRTTPYSLLALDGSSREASSPLVVEDDADPLVHVEVRNGTDERMAYRVIPAIDGGRSWASPQLVLDPGESWSGTVEGPVPEHACVVRLRIGLSADGDVAGVAPLILYIRNERGDACEADPADATADR